jgi:hypothetical protein
MQLRERMNETPFRPLRVAFSDRCVLTIPQHDGALVKRKPLEMGIDRDSRWFAQKYVEWERARGLGF